MPIVLTLAIIAVTFFAAAGTALAVDVIGTTYTLDSNDVVLDVSGTSTITSDGTEYTNVAINCADGTELTIENVNINNAHNTEVYVSPITINGTCTLNFVGDNTLTADENYAAVQVEESASVTIDGTGKLTVQGGKNAAGIGGGYMTYASGITIKGGEIIATGGYEGAGIGYGYCGGHNATSPLTITIKGGDISANGTEGGAGIGYGYGSGEGTSTPGMIINIEGGDIEAIGGDGGAGVGFGDESKEDTMIINISGGRIFATSEDEGAGIGSGDEYQSTGAQNSTINISGGWIEAEGYCCGTAIGAGDDAPWGTINLSGGVINAWADSEDDIGEGCCGWLEDGVYITGSAIVIPYYDKIYKEDYSSSKADYGTHRRIEAAISEGGTLLTEDTKIVLQSADGLYAPTWIGENDDTNDPWFVAYVPDGTYFFTKDDGEKRTESFTIAGADVIPTLNFASVLLDDMAVSEGTLAPAFDSNTNDYVVNVANDIDSLTITPTLHEVDDTVTVDGTAVVSGTASGEIALSVGENVIDVVVTDSIETTVKNTYTVTVNREALVGPDIEGELIDQHGNKISGWTIILKSTPVSVVTDGQGKFEFENVTLENHTLTIKDSSGSTMKVFNLSYTEGSTFGWTAFDDNLSIVVSPQTGTVCIQIEVGVDNVITVKSVTEKIGNPQTGDTTSLMWFWIMIAGVVLCLGAFAVRKRVKNK